MSKLSHFLLIFYPARPLQFSRLTTQDLTNRNLPEPLPTDPVHIQGNAWLYLGYCTGTTPGQSPALLSQPTTPNHIYPGLLAQASPQPQPMLNASAAAGQECCLTHYLSCYFPTCCRASPCFSCTVLLLCSTLFEARQNIPKMFREISEEVPGIVPVRNLGKYRGMIGEKPFFTVKKPSPMLASPVEPCYSIYR